MASHGQLIECIPSIEETLQIPPQVRPYKDPGPNFIEPVNKLLGTKNFCLAEKCYQPEHLIATNAATGTSGHKI